jgi:hypothetical protein
MPVEHSFRAGVLTIAAVGVYEPSDLVHAFLAAMNDPACPRPVAMVFDVSRSESLATRPTDEIRKIAGFLGPYADRIGGRVAVVAPSDVHFGLSRLGAAHSEKAGVDAQIFRTMAEALKWLGVPDSARR